MKYKKLGRTGLLVSEVCLGTMTFGEQLDEEESVKIVKNAITEGVNFIDTANGYVAGKSEEIIGRALKNDRHSVILATKVGAWKSGPNINDKGLSRKHILTEVENSMRRLKTDYIDLYYAHTPDYNTPIDETLRAFDDLVRQGKVRYIACSNYRAWQLCEALWVSDKQNLERYECIQSPYNLITRDVEYELLPLCANKDVGVTVYNPLAGGLLTGKYSSSKSNREGTRFTTKRLGEMYTSRYWLDKNFDTVVRLKKIADAHNQNLTQFSLAWILSNETITSIVVGVSSLGQLQENLKAVELELTAEQLTACDEAWQHISPPRFLYGR